MTAPQTKYTRSGDVHIAYQVLGDGPRDLVLVPGFISHLEHCWEEPHYARFLERLASFRRLILFDKRGTGLSDRPGTIPTLEQRMEDVHAVMAAAGSRRATLMGISEGGSMALLFAATYPTQTESLVLLGTYGYFSQWVLPLEKFDAFIAEIESAWGTGAALANLAPSMVGDPAFAAWWAKFERLAASPAAAITLMRMNQEIDVRAIMPSIRVPTLVLHRTGDARVNVDAARYTARTIPGARLIEYPGSDHLAWVGNTDEILADIEEFVTGSRPSQAAERVLATVMFTDIVDSTRRSVELGDRGWSGLRAMHDRAVRQEIERQRGQVVKGLGDGFLATFDGPARAVRCGLAAAAAARSAGVDIRVGLHTGEVEVIPGDVMGIAVNIAARIAAQAGAGEILVSSTVRDLVAGSGLRFDDRGPQALKGIDEPVRIYAAAGG